MSSYKELRTLRDKYEEACFCGDIDTVNYMIKNENRKLKTRGFLSWCIKRACAGGQYDIFTALHSYRNIKWLCNTAHNLLFTAEFFEYACQGGNLKIIDEVIKMAEYESIQGSEDFFYNGLLGACRGGQLEIFKQCMKLSLGGDLNSRYNMLLYRACESNIEMINYVIECGDRHSVVWNWNYAMTTACREGHVEAVKLFVEKYGADHYYGGLLLSCSSGKSETIKLMMSYDVELITYCLYYVCKTGDLEVIDLLLKNTNELVNIVNFEECASGASRGGHIDILELFISKGASNWNECMNEACKGGHMNIIEFMIAKGANDWNLCLNTACLYRHLEISKLMIERGGNDFNSCMSNACYCDDLDFVRTMIEKGATDFNKSLRSACGIGNVKMAKFIIECGAADMNSCINNIYDDNVDLYNLLISAGATRLDCLEHIDDLKLHCLYCKYKGISPKHNIQLYNELLRKEPACVLFAGSRLTKSSGTCNKVSKVSKVKCHMKRLPSELFSMLIMY